MKGTDARRLSLEIVVVLALAACVAATVAGTSGAVGASVFVLAAAPPLLWRVGRALRAASALRSGPPGPAEAVSLVDTAVRRQAELEQAAAFAVTTALARAVDVSEAAEAVNDALERSTGLNRTAVLLYQEDGVCRFVGWRGLSDEYRRAVEGHCPWAQDAPEAEPIVVQDVSADASLAAYQELFQRERVASLAFVPVIAKSGVVGKLMLYASSPSSITTSSVRTARVIAVSLGTAVTRLRMADALAKSESRLRAVIDTAMDAVVSMDGNGHVTGWNAQAESVFGWPAEEALGRLLHELIIPEELRALHVRGLSEFARSAAGPMIGKRIEVPAQRKDGTQVTVELAIAPVRTPEGVVFSAFLRDITEAKRAADELIEARTAAEAANRAKTEFLANMSHEIRTPLTAILGYTELLRDDGDLARAPERRLETISTIQSAGQHLLTVINDILDISKIEAGKMTIEAVETPVLDILLEVESLMRPRAREKGVTLATRLATPLPERVMSDPTRLRQILVNLVGNAVKFTERGGITLVARTLERDGAPYLVVDVEDTGPGLTRAQAARLFSSFGQADASVTRRHGGTGLGLTISHRLALLLGGSVALRWSEPGKGSSFRLELPLLPVGGAAMVGDLCSLAERVPARAVPKPVVSTTLRGRVLLAEDGRDNQTIIAFYLRRAGAEVEIAANGRIALEMLDRAASEGRPYRLLLTDIQMPEMDGYSLAQTLRARGSDLAIIALTAHAMAEDRQRCLDAGCDDYTVKPVDKARLLALCARWMDERGAARPDAAA